RSRLTTPARTAAADIEHRPSAPPRAVDAGAAVSLEPEMHARKRGHRARRAEHLHPPVADPLGNAVLGLERVDIGGNLLHHAPIALISTGDAAVALRQGDDTDRDRGPAKHLALLAPRKAEPDKLRTAAADVKNKRVAMPVIDQRRAAFGG